MEKIPISFNDQDIKDIEELANLMGIAGVYGTTPKVIKYSIKLAISTAKNPSQVYSGLEELELSYYFTTIKKALIIQRLQQQAQKLTEKAKEV